MDYFIDYDRKALFLWGFFQQLPCISCAEVGVSSPFLPIAPGSLTYYPIKFTLFLADSHFPLVYVQFHFVLPSM